ncbi:hypothetical protein Tco_1019151 [Tanacetum coccineum]|uniref:Uncharacterized protein n=1 Tax=Tanacetum coccineum TaxID=301880 RepID=A0ABQ5FWA4_9ASTR
MTSSTTRFDIEKFDGKNDFGLWKIKMRALMAEVVVAMVREEVPWPGEAMVDWPSVRLIPTTVEEKEDWWFLEDKGGAVDLGVVNSLLEDIPGDVMGESGGETFGVDGGAVW